MVEPLDRTDSSRQTHRPPTTLSRLGLIDDRLLYGQNTLQLLCPVLNSKVKVKVKVQVFAYFFLFYCIIFYVFYCSMGSVPENEIKMDGLID